MSNETNTQKTELVLDLSNVEASVKKLNTQLTNLGRKAEQSMAFLDKASPAYKSLQSAYDEIGKIQKLLVNGDKQKVRSIEEVNKVLSSQLGTYTKTKQVIEDISRSTLSSSKAQRDSLDIINEKFKTLSREARTLKNQYSELGSKKGLGSLEDKIKEIAKQQSIISGLNKKGFSNLNESELKQLDKAKSTFATLNDEVKELKVGLSDISNASRLGNIAKRAVEYTALFAGIAGITMVIREATSAMLEADLASRTLGAILNTNIGTAKNLGEAVRTLGNEYGGSLKDIDEVALSLARAGVAQDKLVKSTEIVLALARLTGDTFSISADAMITYQQVYGDTKSLEELGNILAYVANQSRLSTQDIGTFSNYALATAKSMGVTVNAVSGLATAFSVAGINASTIGTQLRTFFLGLSDDTAAIKDFYSAIGINQKNLLADIQKGGATSDKAILDLITSMKKLDTTTFMQITGEMEKLTGTSFKTVRENYDNIMKFTKDIQNGVKGQLDNTQMILESYQVTFESIWNKFLNITQTGGEKYLQLASIAVSALSFNFDDANIKSYTLGIQEITSELTQLSALREKGIITEAEYQNKVIKGNADILRYQQAIKDVGFDQLVEVNKRIDANETAIKTYKDRVGYESKVNNLEKERISLLSEKAKLTTLVGVISKKNNEVELSDIEKLKNSKAELEKQQKELNKNDVAGFKASSEEISKVTKQIEELERKQKQQSDTLSLIPKFDEANLEVITQKINKLKENGKDYSKEVALLTALIQDQVGKLNNDVAKSLTSVGEAYPEFKKQLESISSKDTTTAITEIIELQKSLFIQQQTALKEINDATTSPTRKAELNAQIDALTKQYNYADSILKIKGEESKLNDKLLIKSPTKTSEPEDIYKRIKVLKEEMLLKQKIDQFENRKGANESALDNAKLEYDIAVKYLAVAKEKNQSAMDIAKFSRDEQEAKLNILKAEMAIKQEEYDRANALKDIAFDMEQFRLGVSDTEQGKLDKLVEKYKQIEQSLIDQEKLGYNADKVKDLETQKAQTLLEINRQNLATEQERIRLLTEEGQRALDLQIQKLDIIQGQVNYLGSIDNEISQKASKLSGVIISSKQQELAIENERVALNGKFAEEYEKLKDAPVERAKLEKKFIEDTDLLNEKSKNNQIQGYADIAGGIADMFEKGSKEAETFRLAQMAIVSVNAINAILSAGMAPPPLGIASMVAMAGMVVGLVSQIGVTLRAFGGNKVSTTSDSFSSMEANLGKGSVLGDSDKMSESITKSLNILEDFAEPQYSTLLSMNKYLESISNNLGGVTSLLIRNAGFALGEGYEGFDTGYKNNLSLNNDIATAIFSGGAGLLLSKSNIPIVSDITGLFGDVVNTVLGGVFGKTKVSQSLKDSGITFADQLLTNAINDFNGSAYQTIETTVTKKSWFSKSSSTTIKSYFQDLDAETERQFTMVIDNLYNSVLSAGVALDSAEATTAKSLENFVVSLGKISLKDKTGDEIQETITAVFSELGDDMARTAFPALEAFQQIGEGLFETMARVATGMEEAEFYISRLGNTFSDVTYTMIGNKSGDVGFEALLLSLSNTEKQLYPVNNNLLALISNLDSTAEELYYAYTTLEEMRDRLIFLGQSYQGISQAMIYGAGSATDLEKGFESFFDNFLTDSERLDYNTKQITDSFNSLNIALPTSKDNFKELLNSIDLTTESGQELYGRLIILSEAFAEVADGVAESIANLETQLKDLGQNGFDTFISGIDSMFATLQSNIDKTKSTIDKLSGKETEGDLVKNLVEYNKYLADYMETGSQESLDAVLKYAESSTDLGGNSLKIAEELKSVLGTLTTEENIVRVNVVDGLGTLLGLNQEQVNQLKASVQDGKLTNEELNSIGRLNNNQLSELMSVATSLSNGIKVTDSQISKLTTLSSEQKTALIKANEDGVITNTELASINTLTQTQKDGILEFAKNSTYFSTEETLYSLNEYMKKQLEVLQKTQAEETAGLSSKSFSYGDYIGKQEQIDIAKRLGVSYESAKPTVDQLQALSISKDPYADIKKIVGFNGEDFTNWNAWNQLVAFDPEHSLDIAGLGHQIYTEGQANKNARIAKETFLQQYQDAINTYSKEKKESDLALSNYDKYFNASLVSKNANYTEVAENIATGTPFSRKGWSAYAGSNRDLMMEWSSKYSQEFKQAKTAYDTLQKLEAQKKLKGYSSGGYTGDGGMFEPAGIVHRGEYVVNSSTTRDLGLNNGNGGVFKEMLEEIKSLKQENTDIKKLMIKLTADNTKQLNTQRALLATQGA